MIPILKPTVAIIGGGLTGVSLLYELSRRGCKATLFEACNDVAQGTSFANGGILTPSMADPWNSPGVARVLFTSLCSEKSPITLRLHSLPGMLEWGSQFLFNSSPHRHYIITRENYLLADYSLKVMNSWIQSLPLDFDYSDNGSLKIFESAKALEAVLRKSEFLGEAGLTYETCDRNRILNIEPLLEDRIHDIAGGIYYPNDRSGDARLFTKQIAIAAKNNGAIIYHNCRVTNITMRNGKPVAVETEHGNIPVNQVVIAAGSGSAKLARKCGVQLNIKPVKGYSLTFDVSSQMSTPKVPVIDDALHAAIVPIGNILRVAGTVEFAGFDTKIYPKRIDYLYKLLKHVYPKLSKNLEFNAAEPWAGLRPMSSDGKPYIGKTNFEGLWINSGHGHLGWTMAAGSAVLLSDMLLGFQTKIPAEYFGIYR